MSALLSAAASSLGVPEPLIERAAAARAAASGSTVDEVLAAWTGGGTIAPSPAPEPAATPTTEPAAAPAAPVQREPEPVGIITAPQPFAAGGAAPAPPPSEVTAAEAANLPEVITVPTAGIRERTNFAMPRWLFAAFLIIPLFALFALGGSATGVCGDATELKTDVVSGKIVNCDGTEFTGSQIGGGGTDYIAQGSEIFAAAPGNCAGCHGANGQGSGTFPALTGVMTTFGSCADHLEWVTLGTQGFQAAGRSTYGDTDKPVGGGGMMPSFASLSEEQLASVVAFERVRLGGGDPEAVLADCGLAAEASGSDGGTTTETTVPSG